MAAGVMGQPSSALDSAHVTGRRVAQKLMSWDEKNTVPSQGPPPD